jgi:hypothetical protein
MRTRLKHFRGPAWLAFAAEHPGATAAVVHRFPPLDGRGDVFVDPRHPAYAAFAKDGGAIAPPSFWSTLRDLVDAGLIPDRLDTLLATLPKFRREQWDELVSADPAVFDDVAAGTAWAIRIQNALHKRIGKPPLGPDGRPVPETPPAASPTPSPVRSSGGGALP